MTEIEKKSPDINEVQLLEACLLLAYEAGKRAGQVELEEHMDREQYWSAMIEVMVSQKTSMPIKQSSIGNEVTYRLRSDERRKWVRKTSKWYLEDAKQLFIRNYIKIR